MPVDHGKDFGTLGQIKGTCVREREEGEGKEGKAEARRQEEEMRAWGSIELQVVQSYWIIECV